MKKTEIDQPEFLSVPEAARLCGVSRNTLYSWVRQEKLKAYQTPGRTNLIRPYDLVQFMQKSGMFVPPGLIDLARKDAAMGIAGGETDASGQSGKYAIMIVDDEPVVRSVLVKALDGIAPIYQASTGYEALHLLTIRDDIRIVLLDISMPGQAGHETFQEIKSMNKEMIVLIVTGYAAQIPEDVVNDKMIREVYQKPVDIKKLNEKVNELYAEIKD